MGVSLCCRGRRQPTIGEALVFKFPSCVWVRMADPLAGTVTFCHNRKAGPGRPRSTVTWSTITGEGLGLSRRTAPARYTVPPPVKLIWVLAPLQGEGKLGELELLSAKLTDTCSGGSPAA